MQPPPFLVVHDTLAVAFNGGGVALPVSGAVYFAASTREGAEVCAQALAEQHPYGGFGIYERVDGRTEPQAVPGLPTAETLARPVDTLDISVRARNALRMCCCRTVGDVLAKGRGFLKRVPNCGATSLASIEGALEGLGIDLRRTSYFTPPPRGTFGSKRKKPPKPTATDKAAAAVARRLTSASNPEREHYRPTRQDGEGSVLPVALVDDVADELDVPFATARMRLKRSGFKLPPDLA